jgi:hypothetical protein
MGIFKYYVLPVIGQRAQILASWINYYNTNIKENQNDTRTHEREWTIT